MKWIDFERQLRKKGIKLFTPLDARQFFSRSKIAITFLLHRLKKQGRLENIKRGLYKLTDEQIPEVYIANKLYEPSYVSLEFALSYHRVIPETVYEITSVTPKATRRFETMEKIFSYRRIKKAAFTGYAIEKQNGLSFQIADPDKAFVDTLYYRILDGQEPLSRFDKNKINMARALRYAQLFRDDKLISIVKATLQ